MLSSGNRQALRVVALAFLAFLSLHFLATTGDLLELPCTSSRVASTQDSAEEYDSPKKAKQAPAVEYGDYIYKVGSWDGAPVVLEEFKLIFFTQAKVGCTLWKQLFRRMMGIKDWKAEQTKDLLPWNAELNGLRYLYHYDRETATEMMTSPDWTRAIFVRDPKERFLSAYLDKAFHETFLIKNCCPFMKTCAKNARRSAENFLGLIKICVNPHWMPQSSRMEDKFWPFIDFVGNMDRLGEDGEKLLKMVGAWEKYGASGWGADGSDSVFQSKAGGIGRAHSTGAREKLKKYISPSLERQLDDFYRKDYESSILGFEKLDIYSQFES